MKRIPLLILLLLGSVMAQVTVEKMYYKDIVEELHTPGDKAKVINLWATWCRPCVAELPHFEAYSQAHKDEVEFIFVSLDFKSDQDTRLVKFLESKGIKSRVIAVQDTDPNEWVDLVNPEWGGAIPATYVVNKEGKVTDFHSAPMSAEELEEYVKPYLE